MKITVDVVPGSFVYMFKCLGRKPDLVPEAQNEQGLQFRLGAAGYPPTTVILHSDGTWTAATTLETP
jgi:hypothetical protein